MEKKKKNIIARLQDFMDSQAGKTFLNYLYSWGAAVVILGALFKLTHIPGANLMLFIGMGTEVVVFFAFDRTYEVVEDDEDEAKKAEKGGEASEGEHEAVEHSESEPATAPVIVCGGTPTGGYATAPVAGSGPIVIGGGYVGGGYVGGGVVGGGDVAGSGPVVIGGGYVGGGYVGGGGAAGSGAPVTNADVTAAASGEAVSGPITIGGAAPMGNLEPQEIESVTQDYIDKIKELTDALQHVSDQSSALERNMEEMEHLGRSLTGINTIYEMQLRSVSAQVGNLDAVNEQTRRMARQIEELNTVYARMLEAMTVNMNLNQNINNK